MIVVTGAAGFIGSCLIAALNERGYRDIVAVDDFSRSDKLGNLSSKSLSHRIERDKFPDWLDAHHEQVEFIHHIGARTDTTEMDESIFNTLNIQYSKELWIRCANYGIPLLFASSAATYGGGESGYDDEKSLEPLHPLNPYGRSKHDFDRWALEQEKAPYYWMGFKFFNVYGPNEYHKGRMASVVYHAFNQINNSGTVKLFRSHKPEFRDGEQLRDFIYVKDVVNVLIHFMEHRNSANNGLYNLGTGKAETFLELVNSVFAALEKEPSIEFIDTPEDIRDTYQYFTEARMEKLRKAGYNEPFMPLRKGVRDYVTNYLKPGRFY